MNETTLRNVTGKLMEILEIPQFEGTEVHLKEITEYHVEFDIETKTVTIESCSVEIPSDKRWLVLNTLESISGKFSCYAIGKQWTFNGEKLSSVNFEDNQMCIDTSSSYYEYDFEEG